MRADQRQRGVDRLRRSSRPDVSSSNASTSGSNAIHAGVLSGRAPASRRRRPARPRRHARGRVVVRVLSGRRRGRSCTAASGKTTEPMSRPSITAPSAPRRRCASRIRRAPAVAGDLARRGPRPPHPPARCEGGEPSIESSGGIAVIRARTSSSSSGATRAGPLAGVDTALERLEGEGSIHQPRVDVREPQSAARDLARGSTSRCRRRRRWRSTRAAPHGPSTSIVAPSADSVGTNPGNETSADSMPVDLARPLGGEGRPPRTPSPSGGPRARARAPPANPPPARTRSSPSIAAWPPRRGSPRRSPPAGRSP